MVDCVHEWEKSFGSGITCTKCDDQFCDPLSYLNDTEKYVVKLRQQIEDMKCCDNCKWVNKVHRACSVCDRNENWQMKGTE